MLLQKKVNAISAITVLLHMSSSQALSSELAKTPLMGWSSWNAFGTNFNSSSIERTVQLFHDLGLTQAGYEYVNLDDGWSAYSRTVDGYLQANETTFPNGIGALAHYIHANGLKLGLYGDSGVYTCEFHPGSSGYEKRDAQTLAEWGVDYWKYDNCGGFAAMVDSPQIRFGDMKDALLLSGRDIAYEVCEWGYQFPWHWGGDIGHSYRIGGDITDKFINETGCACKTAYCLDTGYAGCSVTTMMRKMREISQYQTPGHWAYMDMLQIGNGNMTLYQQQTHFAFWAALKSPLIIGTNLETLPSASAAILTNADIIAINQDPLGLAVHYMQGASIENSLQVWVGEIEGGYIVLVFNEKSYPQHASISFNQLGFDIQGNVNVKELWSGHNWGRINSISTTVESYQTLVFKLGH
ncbi:alpha-galactosidase/alpha-n-acetylgalactosaminidase [Talaromyces proteolyticus]|uniref:Alpha-galactosidase n=1 Tax=Talaromyces proteolyticus TaxID=1131652 RepID=A0AAD4L4V3_9EURO|nr:alpha-galactosidase/alpha-n-acetylgalactosaminidase [Talaromyces proteolyticus]KAH8703602.1 alpha-galactosidase/alpha-n-acetylgalactosaminidase [Talaromyces proteolyticus]